VAVNRRDGFGGAGVSARGSGSGRVAEGSFISDRVSSTARVEPLSGVTVGIEWSILFSMKIEFRG
jgi:hypothetical protein